MSVETKDIISRIREIRELSDMTTKEVADSISIPVEKYEEYENGFLDIPVTTLIEICDVFKISLTEIITGDTPKLHTYSVVRKDKGVEIERYSQYKYQDLAYNFADNKFDVFMVTVSAKTESQPVHSNKHKGQEFHYCVEGSIKCIMNGNEIILNEGDGIFFDSSTPHAMKALKGKDAKILVTIIQ